MANNSRHVWEGWTVQDFIDDLEELFEYKTFTDHQELKQWCKDNQPYYKKHIPEVYNHFKAKIQWKT